MESFGIYTFQHFELMDQMQDSTPEFEYGGYRFLSPSPSWCTVVVYCNFCINIKMYMPKSDAEKVTVKGSHGDSSLQRESDSFRVKRTVS